MERPTRVTLPSFASVEDERTYRKQHLAAAFRVWARLGYDEGPAGHISVRDPGRTDHFWVNPFGMHFAMVRSSDLLLVNHQGDVVVAAESARFTMAYSRIAATPDGSSSYFLPRLVGLRRALELYLTNRVLSAREALDWGLVTRVVPDAELGAAVGALARELAQGPSRAFGQAKRLFHQSTWESLETQMELEAQAIAASGHTEDFRAGVSAFAAKTAPTFRGR